MNPSEIQKQQANQLADLLYQQDTADLSARVKTLATALGIELSADTTSADMATPLQTATIPGRIGIWNKALENGTPIYTRDLEARMDWWLWAKVHQFPGSPAPGKKRVVLLGESVARGYLYDPFYTVAQELEVQMNSGAAAEQEVEVLDLARTDLGLPMLKELLTESLQLSPNAIVIFAGNNWLHAMKDAVQQADYQQLCRLLEQGSLQEVYALLENRFREIVSSFMEFAGDLSRQSGVPIVFVVPEFNLDDWTSNPQEKNITRLNGSGAAKWVVLKESGEEALARKDFTPLEDLASRMIALDLTHPLGYEWKAACMKAAGNWAAARSLLEKARDTAIYSRGETKPRCFAVIRDTIQTLAPANGISVVDLPAVFRDAFPGQLPGRQLFLDYCHLTVQGIKVAMQHTAAVVTGILQNRQVDAATFGDSGLYPDEDVIAVAHIAAAVHNAHYGQPAPVLRYHCSEAAKAADLAKEFMLNFIDFSSRKLQNTLCITHEKVVESGVFTQYEGGLGFIHARRKKLLDVALVDAMVDVITAGSGGKLAEELLQLRITEHMPDDQHDIDLLDACYATTSYDVFNSEIPELNYYQGRNCRSDFVFAADGQSALNASLVCRLPGSTQGAQDVRILVNGQLLTTISLQHKWKAVELKIPNRPFLEKGMNRVEIYWPVPEQYRQTDPATVQTPMEFLDFMYPAWGEIYSFDLRKDPVNGQLLNNNAPGYTEASLLSLIP